jgi:hypothetical protein
MKKSFFILLLLPFAAQAAVTPGTPATAATHCIFIGTNIGEHQPGGDYIIAIGNFKSDMVFKDSSINIDEGFPYFKTPGGKGLLLFIQNSYGKASTKEFLEDLQHIIRTYYLDDMESYVRARHYDKAFYVIN